MFPVVHRKGDTCFQAIRYCPAPDHVSNDELWRSRKARDAGFLEIMKLFDHFKPFFLILFFFYLFVAHLADALLAGVPNRLQNILQVFQWVPFKWPLLI